MVKIVVTYFIKSLMNIQSLKIVPNLVYEVNTGLNMI